MPASDSTNRTNSACREMPCLLQICLSCQRIVLSLRPAAAISRMFLPRANNTAARPPSP